MSVQKTFQAKNIIIAAISVVVGVALMLYVFTDKHVHTWGSWQTTKLTSCEIPGREVRVCTDENCQEREYRDIPAVGEHVYSNWAVVVVADCENEGRQERSCACGETEVQILEARGHNFYEGVCRRCFALEDEVTGN